MNDPVREFLQDRGCGDHLVTRGLAGLVETWEQIVASVKQGYRLGLDDYLNDMDARQLLAEALMMAPRVQQQQHELRVQAADALLQSSLVPAAECLWGDEVAEEEGWTREQNWWYFQYPKNAGEALRADLLDESFAD